MASDEPVVVKPLARRPFSLGGTPSTTYSSRPATPSNEDLSSSGLLPPEEKDGPPSRTRSILNLTSSTLFGIYSPAGYNPDKEEPSTPWGTGSETPLEGRAGLIPGDSSAGLGLNEAAWKAKTQRRRSSVLDESAQRTKKHTQRVHAKRRGFRNFYVPQILKSVLLGAVGVSYGILISHLHDRQQLAPVQVDGIPHHSWPYYGFWAFVAVSLGQLMPWVDSLWEGLSQDDGEGAEEVPTYGGGRTTGRKNTPAEQRGERRGWWAPEWNDVVRSVGAFVGIAFAIRKLPWQSTLQLSLTLALSNPAIWYLLDRTTPCFILSTTVALSGTALTLAINPDLIPSLPEAARVAAAGAARNATLFKLPLPNQGETMVAGLFSQESVGVATWIASVLFVSCVCFGNIGRRL